MILYLNETNLSVEIRLGPAESFSPNEEVNEIHVLAQDIAKKKNEFIADTYNPLVKTLLDKVDALNKKHNPQLVKLPDPVSDKK
jgi:hypothetical protein